MQRVRGGESIYALAAALAQVRFRGRLLRAPTAVWRGRWRGRRRDQRLVALGARRRSQRGNPVHPVDRATPLPRIVSGLRRYGPVAFLAHAIALDDAQHLVVEDAAHVDRLEALREMGLGVAAAARQKVMAALTRKNETKKSGQKMIRPMVMSNSQ